MNLTNAVLPFDALRTLLRLPEGAHIVAAHDDCVSNCIRLRIACEAGVLPEEESRFCPESGRWEPCPSKGPVRGV